MSNKTPIKGRTKKYLGGSSSRGAVEIPEPVVNEAMARLRAEEEEELEWMMTAKV